MGKISNAIKMLNYLNTGNKYNVKQLSEKLGISERMVRYYKNELEEAGIPIETFMGPDGGYYILKTNEPYNQFNKYDLELLEDVYNKLKEMVKKKEPDLLIDTFEEEIETLFSYLDKEIKNDRWRIYRHCHRNQ